VTESRFVSLFRIKVSSNKIRIIQTVLDQSHCCIKKLIFIEDYCLFNLPFL